MRKPRAVCRQIQQFSVALPTAEGRSGQLTHRQHTLGRHLLSRRFQKPERPRCEHHVAPAHTALEAVARNADGICCPVASQEIVSQEEPVGGTLRQLRKVLDQQP